MTEYLEASLPTGASIRLEIEPRTGAIQAGRAAEMLNRGSEVLEEALTTIRDMADSLIKTVNDLDIYPNKIEVTFGVKIDVEAGAVIAKVGTEAHYGVKLVWDFTSTKK